MGSVSQARAVSVRDNLPVGTLVAAIVLSVFWMVLGSLIVESARVHDFLNLYTGASLARDGEFARLHDQKVQLGRERELVPETEELFPFVRPHFYALLLAPLSFIPFAPAFWFWLALQASVLVGCWVWSFRKFGADALIFGALFVPTALGIAHGQDCVFMLAIAIAGICGSRARGGVLGRGSAGTGSDQVSFVAACSGGDAVRKTVETSPRILHGGSRSCGALAGAWRVDRRPGICGPPAGEGRARVVSIAGTHDQRSQYSQELRVGWASLVGDRRGGGGGINVSWRERRAPVAMVVGFACGVRSCPPARIRLRRGCAVAAGLAGPIRVEKGVFAVHGIGARSAACVFCIDVRGAMVGFAGAGLAVVVGSAGLGELF